MKISILRNLALLIVVIAACCSSCNSDKLDPVLPADCDVLVTYDNQVKSIIDRSCAYSGCHDGNGGGNPPGNFQSYSGLESFLNDQEFKKFVIDLKDDEVVGMPPSYAPAGNPQDLTDEELELIQCWISSAYPEN